MDTKKYRFYVIFLAISLVFTTFLTSACDAETDEAPENSEVTDTTGLSTEGTDAQPAALAEINLEAALKERVLGDVNAPIKVTEYSSFTCSHCAAFHKETFKEFKTNYIDTGKAYLVSKEFIRNKVDMHAAATARCMSEMRYFDYIQMLFEKQEDWAYSPNYLEFLKTSSAEYGVTPEMFEACTNSKELQEGVLESVRAAQTEFAINSTPTFIVNDKDKIGGGLPYGPFVKAIETLVSGKGGEGNE
ncbi:DsbA family protein [Alphaproteobacteria bacterium]|nr:DsbA family protein [Alphaproteobacteria bacterium]